VTLTPGAYIKTRRWAQGLTIADVASRVATVPHLAEHARAEILTLIEADAAPATFNTIIAIGSVVRFNLDVLCALARISMGADFKSPVLCRICAWSAYDREWDRRRMWAEPDLCSKCAPVPPASPVA
jgi:hypothetical protein